jgi:hypothetical protein
MNMKKIITTIVTITALVIGSFTINGAENCDGPCTNPSADGGGCGACQNIQNFQAKCPGSTIHINTHQTCGGSGNLWCIETPNQNIGTETPCVSNIDVIWQNYCMQAYQQCIDNCTAYDCDCAKYLNPCQWTRCASGNSPIPLLSSVYSASGGDCPN